ncbi:TRAP transporter 4TM/12TM fusion protein [Rhodobium orientis]|uniref:C4-dicarboxylate ABC transporter permease n=1 Tax=Rhodobium orientis TaxID=34017 RepID=A0A327JK86_9HYPH|nr:TRAP transporter fused permease subunit [Rhodobium orientis]MBB4305227.1 TRAP transporter 4TM/12TM fusion protein [Rhodobium orientis]MBK5952145.1 C4-dicarboxylate ABC transporter permease [Rhodobium orientis]RAI26305.1 C4-dicarboxylate ABC transporter permease [Rhodobium orientis]
MSDKDAPSNGPDGASGGTVAAALPDVAIIADEGRLEDRRWQAVFTAVAVAVSLFHLWANLFATLSTLWLAGVHFAGLAFLCALRFPLFHVGSRRGRNAIFALDVVFGVALAVGTIVLIASENAIYARGVHLAPHEWALAFLTIFGAIELTRRTTGWIIPVLILTALTYVTWWGDHIDGVFRFAGLSVETVVFRSIFSDEGMFGMIGRISSSFVFLFILFGAFLVRSGAGEFIIDIARAISGRLTGGPGFIAVIASGLTGTISGSAVANTTSTGVITIPLMKRSGFPPRFAAGVEAASSTGGQLMPPIMGAGAFVMANYTQIPYLDIVAVSFLPAFVYFLSVAFFVRIEAKRHNIVSHDDDAPRVIEVLKKGGPAFLIPICVLIGLLVYGFTPTFAGGWAILAVVVASWLTPNPMGPRAIVEALAMGARNMITTGVLLIAIGLIVNVIAMASIGNTFSLMITQWAGGNLMIAIVLVALASLVLGMGLPVTAAYIVLATLSAPALQILIVNQIVPPEMMRADIVAALAEGTLSEAIKPFFMLADPSVMAKLSAPMPPADAEALWNALPPEVVTQIMAQQRLALPVALTTGALLSAHMIVFWLSQDSNVTPPVCLTAFAAAAIAKTPPMLTGFTAWRLAKGLYLVPILFAYTPFLTGTIPQMLTLFAIATLGVYALGAAIEGHMEAPIPWPLRILLGAAGVALVWPNTPYLEAAGATVVLAIFAFNIRADRRRRAAPARSA